MNKTSERLVIGGVALLVGLLLGWMVRGVATYNTAQDTVASYDDWRTACPSAKAKDASCEMSQDVVDDKSRSTIARISIARDLQKKQMMGFTLPFGVALEPGIGLQIGKDPVKVYQYRTCNTVGCIAVIPADDKMMAALEKPDADIRLLFAGLDGKPVAVPVSVKGFKAAHSAYDSLQAKRTSWFWRMWS